jgi:hypothetical protein
MPEKESDDLMKRLIEVVVTVAASVIITLLSASFLAGSYRRQIDINTQELHDIKKDGTDALSSHVATFNAVKERVERLEAAQVGAIEIQVKLGQMSTKIDDILERTKRLEERVK